SLQRLVDLPRGRSLGAAVEFGHQEDLLPVAIAQGVAHSPLRLAVDVVPAVVHESDAAIDCAADHRRGDFRRRGTPDVSAAEPYARPLLAALAERSIDHSAVGLALRRLQRTPQGPKCTERFPPVHIGSPFLDRYLNYQNLIGTESAFTGFLRQQQVLS